jgi:predicted nuclease with TOPRIM domain
MTDEMEDGHLPATKSDTRALSARLDAHDKRFDSIEGDLHRLNVGFARMEGDMTELKGKVDILLVVKEDFSRFSANVERMTSYFESCVRKMESQGSMLMEHEARLAKLEPRPQ